MYLENIVYCISEEFLFSKDLSMHFLSSLSISNKIRMKSSIFQKPNFPILCGSEGHNASTRVSMYVVKKSVVELTLRIVDPLHQCTQFDGLERILILFGLNVIGYYRIERLQTRFFFSIYRY